MANPKEKTKTRKGLFGRTITVNKQKNELGQKSKERTVTRDTKKGTKTKTSSRSTDRRSGDAVKIKKREFKSREGLTFGYEKASSKTRGKSREKEKTGYMMDPNVASGKNPTIGKSYTKSKDKKKPLMVGGYANSSRERNIELRDKGPYFSGDSKSISNYEANQEIRKARRMSRGGGYYGA